MASSVRGVAALQEELVKAKESLKDVDENIKKLTGRDPGDNRGPQRRVSVGNSPAGPGGRERLFALARRSVVDEGLTPPAKRRASGGAFSRLGPRVGGPRQRIVRRDSGDEEESSEKPSIQSSVIATPAESRRREDLVREQNKDEKGKARNRRMFGLLLGTLQKFRTEANDETEKERQRKAIEEKLEEKAKEEKDNLRKERQSLFSDRRQKQDKLKRLEQKMELVQIHEEWETETRKLMNFIRTKAKPHIYFLPKTHTSGSEKKLKETKKVLENIIKDRRQHLEEEIEVLTSQDKESEPLKAEDESAEQGDKENNEEKEDDMELQQPQVEVVAQEEEDMAGESTEPQHKPEPKSPNKSREKSLEKSPAKTEEKPAEPVTEQPPPPPAVVTDPDVVQGIVEEEEKENKENAATSAAVAAASAPAQAAKSSGRKRRWDNDKREDRGVVNKEDSKSDEKSRTEPRDVPKKKKVPTATLR